MQIMLECEPLQLLGLCLASLLPQARLVSMLREPVSRLISHVNMHHQHFPLHSAEGTDLVDDEEYESKYVDHVIQTLRRCASPDRLLGCVRVLACCCQLPVVQVCSNLPGPLVVLGVPHNLHR
jgi:hypothetical protein